MLRRITATAISASLLASASYVEAAGGEYRLGPQDRLRVKVSEWRPSLGELHQWSALSGEFTVGAAGTVSLPLVGSLPASGLTAPELGAAIAATLQRKVGLLQRPDASVEVAQFRPFYILGHVERPGEYPYRPGLSVMQAVSLAGGFYRAPDPGLLRLARETIGARGELGQIAVERLALLSRRARLEAEMQDAASVAFPDEVLKSPDGAAVEQATREERLIFEARRTALRSQVEALNQTKALLGSEVETLQAKSVSQERQIQLARRELETVSNLMAKGLTVSPRQLTVEQALAQIESARLDTGLALSRARQDISKADRSILDLRNQRRTEILSELRETQTKLDKLVGKSETTRDLIFETEVIAPQQLRAQGDSQSQPVAFRLMRRAPEGTKETAVTETDSVEPGDVLKVLRIVKRGDPSFSLSAHSDPSPRDPSAPTPAVNR